MSDLPTALREGRCLVVCGAGVSRLATAGKGPGWKQLIEMGLEAARPLAAAEWAEGCAKLLEANDVSLWLAAAGLIQDKLGKHAGGPYRAFLKSAVGALRATDPGVVHALRALAEARNAIATTNYDSVLSEGIGCGVVSWTNPIGAAEILSGERRGILHLHGHWDEPASVVFSAADYGRVRGDGSAQFLQQLAAHTRTLVFVGCSNSGLGDENVGALLEWFGAHWSGLGKKHYVLVREPELGGAWPDAVTPVSYGAGFTDLAPFLASLAPPRAPARAPLPPNPRMIGRRDELDAVVAGLLDGDRPIIVPGGPGMGKTTLALAAAHDARIRQAFDAARVFVDLQAVTAAEGVLRALARELSVESSGTAGEILEAIAAHAATRRCLAILDNFETPWHPDPRGTEDLLGELAAIDGLRLVVTVRGETPFIAGGARKLGDVERLSAADARELFLRNADTGFAQDPALPALLDALDGHPLSIVLMAAQTDGRRELAGLVAAWEEHRAATLARGRADDRLTNVRISLRLSLDQLAARPDARRLLGLIALLPAGLAEEDVARLLPDIPADAARVVEKTRLVELREGRLVMLAPLRETLRDESLASPDDLTRLHGHFLAIAADGNAIGNDGWSAVRDRVTREAKNLDAVCLLAVDAIGHAGDHLDLALVERALRGLAQLHRYGLPASVRALHRALALDDTAATRPLQAECAIRLAAVALRRSDHAAARQRFEQARALYVQMGSLLGEANGIKGLGDIALDRAELDAARAHFDEAAPLYERAGSILGQANCVKSLGDIALDRAEHDAARIHYESATTLYERAGSVLGRAGCIESLGAVALAQGDPTTAAVHYTAARPLFESVGDLMGQAGCLKGLAAVAAAQADNLTAAERYEEARSLYQRIGSLAGQAACLRSLAAVVPDTARARLEEALALSSRIPDPHAIGFAHLDLAELAASEDERVRHREAARAAWTSIGRDDLVRSHLEAIPP